MYDEDALREALPLINWDAEPKVEEGDAVLNVWLGQLGVVLDMNGDRVDDMWALDKGKVEWDRYHPEELTVTLYMEDGMVTIEHLKGICDALTVPLYGQMQTGALELTTEQDKKHPLDIKLLVDDENYRNQVVPVLVTHDEWLLLHVLFGGVFSEVRPDGKICVSMLHFATYGLVKDGITVRLKKHFHDAQSLVESIGEDDVVDSFNLNLSIPMSRDEMLLERQILSNLNRDLNLVNLDVEVEHVSNGLMIAVRQKALTCHVDFDTFIASL